MEIRYNPHALLMARHLGTELNACPCYWPRKKGKIERPFNYIEEQFIKGKHFASMEDLNRRGKDFVESWCNETHTTIKRIPNIHYLRGRTGSVAAIARPSLSTEGIGKQDHQSRLLYQHWRK